MAAALANHSPGPLVVVLAHGDDIDIFCDDLALFSEVEPERFPPWKADSRDQVLVDESFGQRLKLLKRLTGPDPPRVVVTSIQALQQPVPRRASVERQTRRIAVGGEVDVRRLLEWLVENGFHATSAVELARRILAAGRPARFLRPIGRNRRGSSFFGDEVESIRRFEVTTQRSLAALELIDVTALAASDDDREHFAGYLPAGSGSLCSRRRTWRKRGGTFSSGSSGPQDGTASDRR